MDLGSTRLVLCSEHKGADQLPCLSAPLFLHMQKAGFLMTRLKYLNIRTLNEPRREKTGFFAYAKIKTQISFAVTAKLISAFVFATQMVQSLCFLNPIFQASSHLL